MKKIILGEWDGLPIWRYQTAGEALADELLKPKDETYA